MQSEIKSVSWAPNGYVIVSIDFWFVNIYYLQLVHKEGMQLFQIAPYICPLQLWLSQIYKVVG